MSLYDLTAQGKTVFNKLGKQLLEQMVAPNNFRIKNWLKNPCPFIWLLIRKHEWSCFFTGGLVKPRRVQEKIMTLREKYRSMKCNIVSAIVKTPVSKA